MASLQNIKFLIILLSVKFNILIIKFETFALFYEGKIAYLK